MNSEEYQNLANVERGHWYYRGKREFVRRWIEKVRPPQITDTLLDCGAGTGQFAAEMSSRCRVLVLDSHEESLAMLRKRFSPEQVLALTGDQVPLPNTSLEYITALDVLEHVPDDQAVVDGFARLLKPGGVAVVTVPASMALWSDWDVVLHHFRRYSKPQLQSLFTETKWDVTAVHYTNVAVFPLVWIARRWQGWFRGDRNQHGLEHNVPPKWINMMLRVQFVWSAMIPIAWPFGISLLLVARRKA